MMINVLNHNDCVEGSDPEGREHGGDRGSFGDEDGDAQGDNADHRTDDDDDTDGDGSAARFSVGPRTCLARFLPPMRPLMGEDILWPSLSLFSP